MQAYDSYPYEQLSGGFIQYGEKEMNEREYDLLEYGAITAGFCLITQWLIMSYIFSIPMTTPSVIFYIIIGIITMFLSIIAHFKKILFIQEMKGYIQPKEWKK
jgi:uncharacterized membrane protein YuzA (DUF378 family)